MKTKFRSALFLATFAATVTSAAPMVAHADPAFWGHRCATFVPVTASVCDPAPVVASAPGDYLPHLAHAYRLGYCAGRNDRACGFERNYRRAFEASDSGWESYFQEGYADGYECRPMNH